MNKEKVVMKKQHILKYNLLFENIIYVFKIESSTCTPIKK